MIFFLHHFRLKAYGIAYFRAQCGDTSNLTPQNLSAIIIMIAILRGINLLALFKDEETTGGWHNPVTLVSKS